MQHQGLAARVHLRGSYPLSRLVSVLGGVECRPRLPYFLQLQASLNLFGPVGGLDQIPDRSLTVYETSSLAFGGKTLNGTGIEVEFSKDQHTATIHVCQLSPGGMWDPSQECSQQTGAQVLTHVVHATPP